MSSVCKMADNRRLTVDQKVKVVLFYAETSSVIATQRRFRAHFGTRWAPFKQTIYRLSLGTIFQSMRINSAPDVKCFCNNKNVLCVQSMVWHFVCHPVYMYTGCSWFVLGYNYLSCGQTDEGHRKLGHNIPSSRQGTHQSSPAHSIRMAVPISM